jgi:hypothetical protein
MKYIPQAKLDEWGMIGTQSRRGRTVIGWIVLALLLVLVLALGLRSVCARPFVGTFTPSTAETNGWVSGYNICIATTNNASRQAWLWVNVGVTNFPFDTTNMPLPNPVLFFGNTVGTNGQVSAYSAPFLFDTNNYPLPVTISLTAPTTFNVRTN